MLSVTCKPHMLSVVTLNVIILNVVMLSVVMLSVMAPSARLNPTLVEPIMGLLS